MRYPINELLGFAFAAQAPDSGYLSCVDVGVGVRRAVAGFILAGATSIAAAITTLASRIAYVIALGVVGGPFFFVRLIKCDCGSCRNPGAARKIFDRRRKSLALRRVLG